MQRVKPQENDLAAPLENVAEIKDDTAVLEVPEQPPETPPVRQPNENEPHIVIASM